MVDLINKCNKRLHFITNDKHYDINIHTGLTVYDIKDILGLPYITKLIMDDYSYVAVCNEFEHYSKEEFINFKAYKNYSDIHTNYEIILNRDIMIIYEFAKIDTIRFLFKVKEFNKKQRLNTYIIMNSTIINLWELFSVHKILNTYNMMKTIDNIVICESFDNIMVEYSINNEYYLSILK